MEFRERKRWVFFGLPFTFTVYTIKEDVITVNTGILNRGENDSSPQLVIEHIKKPREIKQFILEQSEIARRKRLTMNMLDIGAEGELDT